MNQLQAAISHSKNSIRSESIQLFDKNPFYYVEHPLIKEKLFDALVGNLVADHYAPDIFLPTSQKQ